eukprot:COSAG02_NODE_68019_length_251_cov_1.026316_1_plen_32_part_10
MCEERIDDQQPSIFEDTYMPAVARCPVVRAFC